MTTETKGMAEEISRYAAFGRRIDNYRWRPAPQFERPSGWPRRHWKIFCIRPERDHGFAKPLFFDQPVRPD
jgi:hypothetical protein